MNSLVKVLLVLAVIVGGFFILNGFIYNEKQAEPEDPSISSFEECVEAGYPSLDSYPEQCETPSGKRFVRNLPEEELQNLRSSVVVHGMFTCLPHWNTEGPQTLECAFGLEDAAGNYYTLRDRSPSGTLLGGMSDTPVTVVGTLTPGSSDRYQSIGEIEVEEVREWQETRQDAVSFFYPEDLGTTYIRAVDWPPQVTFLEGFSRCLEAGEETERAGRTEERMVYDRTYCVTTVTEGAAGSVYHQYSYISEVEGEFLNMVFSLQYPQCGNYPEPEMSECENEQQTFYVDSLVHSLFESTERI